MKKTFKIIGILGLVMITSCNKEIEVCVDGNMSPSELGVYTYTWCGQNATQIYWTLTYPDGNTQSVLTEGDEAMEATFDLTAKGQYNLFLETKNKKKDANQYFQINVGNYETRFEPKDCGGLSYLSDVGTDIKVYIYPDYAKLQADLRAGVKTNCIDSVAFADDLYYNKELNLDPKLTASFSDLPNGQHVAYIQEYGGNNRNNLPYLNSYEKLINVSQPTEEGVFSNDQIYSPKLTANNSIFFNNLFTKTFLLTDLVVNGTPSTISTCNADDNFVFNLDRTWTLDVGADDCSGGQTTSIGTYNGYSSICGTNLDAGQLTVTSGSLLTSNVNMSYVSNTKIKLTIYSGSTIIEETFTAQ